MLDNILLAWLTSLLVILGYEAVHFRYLQGRHVPHVLMTLREIVLILSGIFYYTASAFLGAVGALYLLNPATMTQGRFEAAGGVLIGMWLLAILLQLLLNVVRNFMGAERRPIVFFNRNALLFARRRKKDGGP